MGLMPRYRSTCHQLKFLLSSIQTLLDSTAIDDSEFIIDYLLELSLGPTLANRACLILYELRQGQGAYIIGLLPGPFHRDSHDPRLRQRRIESLYTPSERFGTITQIRYPICAPIFGVVCIIVWHPSIAQ